jgi:hypothetical protein
MKKLTLLHWGAICMFAAAVTGMMPYALGNRPRTRPEMLGQAVGQLLVFAVGVGLVIMHFVRGKGKSRKRDRAGAEDEVKDRPAKKRQRPRSEP